jgi:hypothetical protein
MSIEAMKQALGALKTCNWVDDGGYGHAEYDHVSTNKAITALRQAIEQAEQAQPVANDERVDALRTLSYCDGLKAGWDFCATDDHDGFERAQAATSEAMRVLRTAPQTRQPLTDEQIKSQTWMLQAAREYEQYTGQEYLVVDGWLEFARAIEAAHGIKEEA